jgi:SAM-dependent methyltransferase
MARKLEGTFGKLQKREKRKVNTLNYIKEKYNLSFDSPMPIILKGVGRHSGFKELLKELGFTSGAEIGTRVGSYAKELCIAIPKLKLYCIDPWKIYPGYEETFEPGEIDRQFEEAKERLSPYNCEIIKKESMEAVREFEPESLDFVFIDGNHEHKYVLEDISEWTRKVKPGGIIYGHDYMPDHPGVMSAVHEYISKNSIYPWFVLRVGRQADCFCFVKKEEKNGI